MPKWRCRDCPRAPPTGSVHRIFRWWLAPRWNASANGVRFIRNKRGPHRQYNAQGRQVTDRKEDYYQPWLRDTTPTPGGGAPMRDEGLAKPKEEPPIGIDLTRHSKPEKPRGEPLVKHEAHKAGAAHLWRTAERRGGKGGVRTGRSRGSRGKKKK